MSVQEGKEKEKETEPTEKEFNAGELDIAKLLDDPKVLEALIKHEKVKAVVDEAVKKATVKAPEKELVKKIDDDDVALLKKRFLSDAISKLDKDSLSKFTLETDGLSLVKKMEWIDKNVTVKPEPKPAATGLPAGGSKPVGYFDPGYKHQFIDNRKK